MTSRAPQPRPLSPQSPAPISPLPKALRTPTAPYCLRMLCSTPRNPIARQEGVLNERNLETSRKTRTPHQTKRFARLRLRLPQTTQGTANRRAPRAQRRRALRSSNRRLRGRPRLGLRQHQESRRTLRHQPVRNVMARSRRSPATKPQTGRRQSRCHAPAQKKVLEFGRKSKPLAHRCTNGTRFATLPTMAAQNILINRAPVLTLWAATVAERLGFNRDEALSLGKAVASLNAQSKGRRLGIYKPAPQEIKKARARKRGQEFFVEIAGRQVPAVNTEEGVRAVIKDKPIAASGVKQCVTWRNPSGLRTFRKTHSSSTSSFAPRFRRA